MTYRLGVDGNEALLPHDIDSLLAALSPDNATAGRQFEEIVEWFLRADPEYRLLVRRVWRWAEWPGRWGVDTGVDLVAEDYDGNLWAVQAKAYRAMPSLSLRDLATFFAATTRRFSVGGQERTFAMGLVVSSAATVGRHAADFATASSTPIGFALLDRLRNARVSWPADPDRLTTAPESAATAAAEPRPHQVEAIATITEALTSAERAQAVMACGTGKTLVGLWSSEALQANRSLVLVPSLALVRQTIGAWSANARSPFRLLAVCSDETVTGSDDLRFGRAELGLPTTVDPTAIGHFLRGRGRRVIIGTYQSAGAIAEAQSLGAPPVDLLLCDEAHRMAGPASGLFARPLDGSWLRARRRLFMTATPRIYSARARRVAADSEVELSSMDDHRVFGRVAYELSFGEAIRRGLLSDYQVLVIGCDDPEQAAVAARRDLVADVAGDAGTLAAQIGLLRAMRREDLRRVVSFHGRVKAAKGFAVALDSTRRALGRRGPSGSLHADFVAGSMSIGERERRLAHLRALDVSNRCVLANARCLSEGVDVPSIDGIAFIDPKGSAIDIVQSIGRVMRLSPDKAVGTVVVPVVVTPGDDDEDVLSSSSFQTVWAVLRALRAHDSSLGEALDEWRQALGKGIAPHGLPGKLTLDLPRGVGPEFMRAFEARLVRSTTSSWEENFGALLDWVAQRGTARVRQGTIHSGRRLGAWVNMQRHRWARGELSAERARRLEALPGWAWDAREAYRNEMLDLLAQYAVDHGHARLATQEVYRGERLGQWASNQRALYAAGKMPSDLADRLEAIQGWHWNLRDAQWFTAFEEFKRVVLATDSTIPPLSAQAGGVSLRSWVVGQRALYREGSLAPDRVAALESIPGWQWDPADANWRIHFSALEEIARRHGTCIVPQAGDVDGLKLGRWVSQQRVAFHGGRLPTERATLLEALPGWTWNQLDANWLSALDCLRDWSTEHGGAAVPQTAIHQGFRLGGWATRQRQAYRDGSLSAVRIAALEAVPGWAWDPLSAEWQRMFELLVVWQAAHPDRVTPGSTERYNGVRLGGWVAHQRMRHRKGRMKANEARLLESLRGWSWDANDERWESMFGLLTEWTAQHGHAAPPHSAEHGGHKLGQWVGYQRGLRERGQLSPDRAQRLEAMPGWRWRGGPTRPSRRP